MNAATLAELVRLPAALTVPGDTLAGAAAGGPGARGRRRMLLPASSVFLYWAGMALNDYADRELDRVERPERPIPSGRVRAGQALALAAGLSFAGVGLAAWAGGRPAARTAAALTGVVWSYDLVLKEGPAGPLAMAAARGLDVLLGAGGTGRDAVVPAALMASHTAGVTLLSRGEVHGSSKATAAVTTAGTALTAAAAGLSGGRRPRGLALALAATYGVGVGRAQAAAVTTPDAGTVRRATGAGIRGMIPLQSTLLAAHGAPRTALGLLAVGPVVRAASKVVSPT
jgi:4-hydroxybenzoate polyprenyltransferase